MIDQLHQTLAKIRIVLVGTTHPGNIGATARALKTMGLNRLELVAPRCAPDAETMARAAGADDLVEHAGMHQDLVSALAGCRLVIGASARLRSLEWPTLEPPECAVRLLAEARVGDVALVLGRERSGLTNEELARCHYLVHIPANPAFSSLNVAAAAQVLAYEIRQAARRQAGECLTDPPRDLATAEEMEGFYVHLAATLIELDFSDPEQSRTLNRRLRRLFNRARPDRVELNILRGILSAAQGRKRPDRFTRRQSPTLVEQTPPQAYSD